MGSSTVTKTKQATLSTLAGVLFLLAGALDLFMALWSHHGGSYAMGSLMTGVGVLWLIVGLKPKRELRVSHFASMEQPSTSMQEGDR